eukprot:1494767-Pleurochrysis_carterae.AAC.5
MRWRPRGRACRASAATTKRRARTQPLATLSCVPDLHDGADGGLEVVALWLGRVEDLDRVQPAGHLHQRRRVEVGLELARVERCTHHDQLEVGPLCRNFLDEAEEDVGGERALVRLVEDHRSVALEQRVRHRLAQQHAVRHVLQDRLGPRHVLETDRVPNLLAQLDVHLLGHALRDAHRRHATRLRACHQLTPASDARVHHEGRDLRRLAGARLTDEDDGLVLLHHFEKLVLLLPNGKLLPAFQNLKELLRVRAIGVRVDGHPAGSGV